MLIDGFIQKSLATPAINTLLQGRIYEDALPRGYHLPAAVVHAYDGSQDYDMRGPITQREDGIQVDVYAETSAQARAIVEAVRATFGPFVGELPDGTVVLACYVQRQMSLPFLTTADAANSTKRYMIGFHVVSNTL